MVPTPRSDLARPLGAVALGRPRSASVPRRRVTASRGARRSPPPRVGGTDGAEGAAPATVALPGGGGVVRVGPREPPDAVIDAAMRRGSRARRDAVGRARSGCADADPRTRGATVAVVPEQWAQAASGVDVVIGTRIGGLGADRRARRRSSCSTSTTKPSRRSARPRGTPVTSPSSVGTDERCRRLPRLADPVRRCTALGRDARRRTDDRRVAGRVADRRHRRPQPRRAVEDVARHAPADRRAARPRPHGGVCSQHHGTSPRSCLPDVPLRCNGVSGARRQSGSTTSGSLRLRPLRASAVPPCARSCAGTGFANLRPGVTRLREELEAAAGPNRRQRHRR